MGCAGIDRREGAREHLRALRDLQHGCRQSIRPRSALRGELTVVEVRRGHRAAGGPGGPCGPTAPTPISRIVMVLRSEPPPDGRVFAAVEIDVVPLPLAAEAHAEGVRPAGSTPCQ